MVAADVIADHFGQARSEWARATRSPWAGRLSPAKPKFTSSIWVNSSPSLRRQRPKQSPTLGLLKDLGMRQEFADRARAFAERHFSATTLLDHPCVAARLVHVDRQAAQHAPVLAGRGTGAQSLPAAWQSLAGLGTIYFIIEYFTSETQGYYQTFLSLIALQSFSARHSRGDRQRREP
ncbi:MAG: hypothetical protein WKF37_16980 [Bryobacteraceae bacterium]